MRPPVVSKKNAKPEAAHDSGKPQHSLCNEDFDLALREYAARAQKGIELANAATPDDIRAAKQSARAFRGERSQD
jgi:hypothetical protein